MDNVEMPGMPAGCPSPEELTAFNTGKLSLHRLEAIANHIATCPLCESTLLTLNDQTPLIAHLRQLATSEPSFVDEPEFAELKQYAHSLGPDSPAEDHVAPHPAGYPQLPGFRITARIADGTLGTVYRAQQTKGHRTVALKIIPQALAGDARRHQRLWQDVAMAARLSNARVLPILDAFTIQDAVVLVSPFIEGNSLAAVIKYRRMLRQGRLVARAHPYAFMNDHDYIAHTMQLLDQVIDNLAAIHEVGGNYRELKPGNCLIDNQDHVWFSDFGLSRLVNHWGSVLIHDVNRMPGSGQKAEEPNIRVSALGYLSPEQWAGRKDVDQRSDIFNLGVLLYQALTLELPYGISPITRHRQPPGRPSQRQRLLPASYDAVILNALQINREQRYPSALALRHDWRALRGSPAGALPPAPSSGRSGMAYPPLMFLTGMVFTVAGGLLRWMFR